MSDSSQAIVDVDAGAEEAPRLAKELRRWLSAEGIVEPDPSDCILGEGQGHAPGPRFLVAVESPPSATEEFLALASNGLRIAVGRQVFDTGGNGIELTCAGCGSTFEPGSGWMDAVAEWHSGNDDAAFSCPFCNNRQRLARWRGPCAWGFGHLGLEFWNWPSLSREFVRGVEHRLKHRTVLVRCHL
jgi:hypothetical protein